MDSLHSNLVGPKSLQRQARILNVLFESNTALSFVELSEILGFSTRTIINDLKYLAEILPDNIEINIDEHNLVVLSCQSSFLFYRFLTTLVTISPLYKIVDSIFDDILYSFEDWAELLFLSDKTLQRYLTKLKEIVKQYELEDFCIRLTMLTSIYLERQNKSRVILFVLSGDAIYIDYVVNQFRKIKSHQVQLLFAFDANLEASKLDLQKVDIVVTNGEDYFPDFEEKGIPIIYVSAFPTAAEIEKIRMILQGSISLRTNHDGA